MTITTRRQSRNRATILGHHLLPFDLPPDRPVSERKRDVVASEDRSSGGVSSSSLSGLASSGVSSVDLLEGCDRVDRDDFLDRCEDEDGMGVVLHASFGVSAMTASVEGRGDKV
jgi:hypothetical protein